MGRLIFLGTASALPSEDRGNTLLAVSGADDAGWLLIDCGGDPYRALQRAGIPADGVRDLLVTHGHIDHMGSLPSLIEGWRLGGRREPLRVWALPEVLGIVRRILDLFSYELTLDTWPFPITLQPVEPSAGLTLAGIPARAARMDHALPSIGVRLELPAGPICYSCDTQPTPALPALARGASLLIAECTFLQRHVDFARMSKHMTALEAGQQAAAAGARALALVHLGVAEGWQVEEARTEAAGAFAGHILIPHDGEAIAV